MRSPTSPARSDVFCTYVGEGTNVSVAVTRRATACEASTVPARSRRRRVPEDMRLQRMLGHLSRPVAQEARVGAGRGLRRGRHRRHLRAAPRRQAHRHLRHRAAGADRRDADVRQRELPRGRRHRPREPTHVNGKQVEVVYDDGRHFLRTTQEKFDIITSDPIDPWVKGCAALNTVEYFRDVPRSPRIRAGSCASGFRSTRATWTRPRA